MRVFLNLRDDERAKVIEAFKAHRCTFDTVFKGRKIRLDEDEDRFFFDVSDKARKPEGEILESIQEYSLREHFPADAKRERGVYSYNTASTELERHSHGDDYDKEYYYLMEIRGKSFDDVLELSKMIKAGTIRPAESFEGEQNGMSKRELEQKHQQALNENLQLVDALKKLTAERDGLVKCLENKKLRCRFLNWWKAWWRNNFGSKA